MFPMSGYVWMCLGMFGYVWLCLGVFRCVWVCLDTQLAFCFIIFSATALGTVLKVSAFE